uniref:Uncharacterized protein n=1 Tax=Anguilla anguilla TaxID=7936 RepID=A0A0E9S4P3_ANGAN
MWFCLYCAPSDVLGELILKALFSFWYLILLFVICLLSRSWTFFNLHLIYNCTDY